MAADVVLVIVAAPPGRPGVEPLLQAALDRGARGADVRLLWTDAGLEGVAGPWPARLAQAGAKSALCAASARRRGWDPERLPAGVAWSSLTSFLAGGGPDARVWGAFP